MKIETRDLRLTYGHSTTALDGLTLTLEGPAIHGLLGRNGSGKTSFLSLLAGFRRHSGGSVTIDGEEIFENGPVMRRVCLIRESGDTVEPSERISDALSFAAANRPNWNGDYALRLLDRFAVSTKKKLRELSRGQRAALACTLGLASRAPLTMFDETYLGMDAPTRYSFYDELLRDHIEHPRLIILSTHLIDEASRLFEQVVVIQSGRLILHDTADAVRAKGVTLTGPAPAVEQLTAGLKVLSGKALGQTRSVVVYKPFPDELARRSAELGVEVSPLPLQDLFVHLTGAEGKDHS